jgi:hypothetical protein
MGLIMLITALIRRFRQRRHRGQARTRQAGAASAR